MSVLEFGNVGNFFCEHCSLQGSSHGFGAELPSLVIFLEIGEGQTCFILNPGRVIVFFGKEKISPCRFYFVYTSKATCRD